MNRFALLGIVVTTFLLAACTDKASIRGSFIGGGNRKIVLEELTAGRSKVIDSVHTNSKGKFKFRYKFRDTAPVFLNVRDGHDFITLLVSPGEKIRLKSVLNLSKNYEVSGSPESEKLSLLNGRMSVTYQAIDSLYRLYNGSSDPEYREVIGMQISQLYVKQKKFNIEYIVHNPTSLTAITALLQSMPNGIVLFGTPGDYPYFKMVSDSLSSRYPTSSHVRALIKSMQDVQNRIGMNEVIVNSLKDSNTASFPELILNDMFGMQQRLSDLQGKVILLSFWDPMDKNSPMLNRELVHLYRELKDKGLEIYQVGVTNNEPLWVNAVVEQDLPWISVLDPTRVAARSYNVRTLPANCVIDRNGKIVGTNLWGNDLVSTLNRLLK